MKYATLSLLLGSSAATTVFPCPHTIAESLGVRFDIDVNTKNCRGKSIEPKIRKFLQNFAGEVSGATKTLGVFEVDNDLCQDDTRRNLRSRKLLGNWGYNGGSTCNFCPPWDDDFRRLGEGGPALDELQYLLSTSLTDLATEFFTEDKESCLFGQDIIISVTFEEGNDDCSKRLQLN